MKRSSGILMHISSLPSPYGIGTFGKEAYEFVDFLDKACQKYWQILPLNPTSYGDSPYQSPSAFAGNPNFIDFDILKNEGLLKSSDYQTLDFGEDDERVDYGKIFKYKLDVLKKAFESSQGKYDKEIEVFRKKNSYWIEDYALYMTIKYDNNLRSWHKWPEDIKHRKSQALKFYRANFKEEINFWIFLQFMFFKQWIELKTYANNKNIKIIGDIPIYLADDSADVWSKSENFLLDKEKELTYVAGVPPDDFSDIGQYWGNPIYDWAHLESNGYDWWVKRVRANLELYDVLRLDHFRGFESYWTIEAGSKTAVTGKWRKGPNIDIFNTLKERLGKLPIIIEDLGEVTEGLIDLRRKVGFPAIKVLEFAFSGDENNEHLPHHHTKNWVVYTGTHDNHTVRGWLENCNNKTLEYAKKYLALNEEEGYTFGMIRGAWSSVANLSIAQMQDFLNIGNEGRMNSPNTSQGNWQWRVKRDVLTDKLAEEIKDLTKTYGRLRN